MIRIMATKSVGILDPETERRFTELGGAALRGRRRRVDRRPHERVAEAEAARHLGDDALVIKSTGPKPSRER